MDLSQFSNTTGQSRTGVRGNLQQISNKIQDTLKWDTMLVIRSDGRHFEALPEFVCGKALSYGRSSNLEINP